MRAPFPRPSAGSVCQPFTGGDLAHGCAGARCALCGAPLGARGLRYQFVSPYRPDAKLTACHTCYKVARGEGYRPVT